MSGTGTRTVPVPGAIAMLLALAAACDTAPPSLPARFTVDRAVIESAVTSPERLAADRDRDPSSKPAEVLEFLGIARGMRVLDMNAAAGYYAELLARVVGPTGHVIAHNHPGARTALAPQDFERRYGGDRLPNTEQLFVTHNGIALAPGSLDAVLMSMVYHDTYWYDPKVDWGPVDRQALLESLYAALAPGGVVGVVDHDAAPGADPHESAHATHRIDAAVVRRDFAAAGFELEAESDALRNPADDRTLSVFDHAVHGRTDRFVMRFRRADRTPSILQIVIEHIEPGREADYSAIEERLAEICVRLSAPNSYLALESVDAPTRVVWLNMYASQEDVDRVARAYARNEPLLAELGAAAAQKKGVAATDADLMMARKPSVAGDAPWRVGAAPFAAIAMDGVSAAIAGRELRPIAETLNVPAVPAAVFETEDGRRFVIGWASTREQANAVASKLGPSARVFAVHPSWSKPADEWVAANPELWARR
ncbi:MAG TPA: hypothetical protein VE907_09815 [Gammaproteobacteria bacterium]|nr:hypothetical protein [Gammaproteobacteria bacterium]